MGVRQLFIFVFIISLISLVSAQSFSGLSNNQFSNPSFNSYYSSGQVSEFWQNVNKELTDEQCGVGTDFYVAIPPGGCTPAVVRSDLLAEQNVPVFCKLEGFKINPLIQVSSIKSISFQGDYPKEVAGISYHPSRAALRSYNSLVGTPSIENLGYVTIILRKQPNETASEKFISGNLTATMNYDAQKAFGVGKAEFFLKTMDENDWQNRYMENSFWYGKGYLRVIDTNNDRATVAVYTDKDKKVNQFTLRVGETSSKFYFPGLYCQAGLKLKINNIVSDEDSALLDINGDSIWVRKGSKVIDNRCTVTDVNIKEGNAGNVLISCPGQRINLNVSMSYSAVFSIDSEEKITNVGEKITDNYYLGYVGNTEISISNINTNTPIGTHFVVLIKSDKQVSKSTYTNLQRKIENVNIQNRNLNLNDFKKSITPSGKSGNDIEIIFGDEGSKSLDGKQLSISRLITQEEQKLENSANELLDKGKRDLANEYMKKADDSVQTLLSEYPLESKSELNEKFGELAIIEAVNLIDQMISVGVTGYGTKKVELLNKFLELYPSSQQAGWARQKLRDQNTFDLSNAYSVAYVNNDYHTIGLVSLRSADYTQKKASISIDGEMYREKLEGDEINLTEDGLSRIVISDIQPKYLEIQSFYRKNSQDSETRNTFRLNYDLSGEDISRKTKVGETEYNFLVSNIDLEEVVSVSLIPEVATSSKANFTFNIGVEQRNIKITPEKAKEVSSELNETIKKWEERNAKLGQLVEQWNGVCLATGLALNVKNLFDGFTGEATSRPKVMEAWREYCDNSTEFGRDKRDQCYNSKSQEIEGDVRVYEQAVKNVNTNLAGKSLEQWKASLTEGEKTVEINLGNNKKVTPNQFLSLQDAQAYLLDKFVNSSTASPELKKSVRVKRDTQLNSVAEGIYRNDQLSDLRDQVGAELSGLVVPLEPLKLDRQTHKLNYYNSEKASTFLTKLENVNNSAYNELKEYLRRISNEGVVGVAYTQVEQKQKLIIISGDSNVGASCVAIYNVSESGNKIKVEDYSSDVTCKNLQISPSASGIQCRFNYQLPRIKFYETGANKGLAGLVPFKQEGWYVYVPGSSGGIVSEGVKGYSESGVPNFYYICSVGANGLEEFRGGDDRCFSSNINSDANTFGGCSLSSSEVSRLRAQAEEALREAGRQYGNKQIRISSFSNTPINVDSPMGESGGDLLECTDFMSVNECKLLYNVCDPVVCPTSRCDFGGKYPVSNVIQSGIVGSLTLCLPNFIGFEGGDVVVPVCLSGLNAGIDGYISILKAQQACMDEAAKTGKHVGICDEITAVYKCEFFWRQASPLLKNIIPDLAEFLYNGGTKSSKGGGEYLTFRDSWDNMQKGLNYFKNTYAQTSFRAIEFGSVEEFGTQFCNGFVGTSFPTSAKGLNSLLEPESPYQFYAQFNEIPFTEATVPATSQYKVFYHIYAGKNQGASFQVYLKNPPATSYYQNAQFLNVKTGFVAAGQQATESVDFTSPAGYKELCVRINGKEHCGFQSVTTDFGLDLLSDSYDADQAKRTDIKTEKECIQGSASVLGLGNLNPQAGVEESINPRIDLRGIVRVCATQNPGLGVNAERWKEVGNCGEQNLKCWLDENSVNNNVAQIAGLDEVNTISEAKNIIDQINLGATVLTQEDSKEKLVKLRQDIEKLNVEKSDNNIETKIKDVLSNATYLANNAYLNSERAEALYLTFKVYEKVVKGVLEIKSQDERLAPSLADAAPNPVQTDSSLDINQQPKPIVSVNANSEILIDGKETGYKIAQAGSAYSIQKINDGSIIVALRDNQQIVISSEYSDLQALNNCRSNSGYLDCNSLA